MGIVKKTKEGANQIIDKAKHADERHDKLAKLKNAMVCTLKNVAAALQFAADKMKESRNKRSAARNQDKNNGSEPEVGSSFSYEAVNAEEVAAVPTEKNYHMDE